MNLPPVIGAYAAIRREEGLPFSFPGGPSWVLEAADARLVAGVLEWAAQSPAAADETFNVTNGDVFEWRSVWPALADELGVRPGGDEPLSLGTYLPEHADVWERIVARHDLRPISLADLLGESHHYADFCFAYGAEPPLPFVFVSTIKLRKAGFHEYCDTEASFRHWLRVLIERRIIPGA